MAQPPSEGRQKQHCWECLHRNLVCDSARPKCARCAASGVDCPGYGGNRPVRFKWLAPGTVKSRTRNKPRAYKKACLAMTVKPQPPITLLTGRQYRLMSSLEFDPTIKALYEGVEYFNSCIYTGLLPLTELGVNPHVYRISTTLLEAASTQPQYLQLSMICMILGHYMAQLTDNVRSAEATAKFYKYRGMAIRRLNVALSLESQSPGDWLLLGVLTQLLVDAQHGLPRAWRWHLQGLEKLITLRGGLFPVSQSVTLQPFLVSVVCIAVMSNMTSPATDMVMAEQHMDNINHILHCTATSALNTCPSPLFAEIIRINYLRHQMTVIDAKPPSRADFKQILERISIFDVDSWALARSNEKNRRYWQLVGDAYKNAVELYCMLALGDIMVPPAACKPHVLSTRSSRLHTSVTEAIHLLPIKRLMFWPLVVLGASASSYCNCNPDAAPGVSEVRAFVSTQLVELSRHLGSFSPLVGKDVLEAFWRSGRREWDVCFDQPYVFTSQIAIDMSGSFSGKEEAIARQEG